ncbi:hypothetical protein BDK51DRAFT_39073 [Blyttiomyces helicus]|uniref:Uncharacterized protein n=1 Tax=Blyttiomyces helicus TaxID=388810 RepID=A0A4P9W5R3_9FUNG|nr:hypothetical protein BDK51DRAFT_39073 [Blyttiomyces helicus]|eukprot:RKO87604.1 hypothetical protein BDK51DRAFT_39073 [Blyttiomyces helicus]
MRGFALLVLSIVAGLAPQEGLYGHHLDGRTTRSQSLRSKLTRIPSHYSPPLTAVEALELGIMDIRVLNSSILPIALDSWTQNFTGWSPGGEGEWCVDPSQAGQETGSLLRFIDANPDRLSLSDKHIGVSDSEEFGAG